MLFFVSEKLKESEIEGSLHVSHMNKTYIYIYIYIYIRYIQKCLYYIYVIELSGFPTKFHTIVMSRAQPWKSIRLDVIPTRSN